MTTTPSVGSSTHASGRRPRKTERDSLDGQGVADLVAIGEYIAEDNPAAARAWLERLRRRAELAAEAPLGGRRVPEIGREDVRETFLRSYRIVYRVEDGGITVLTVFEGHRLMGDLDADEK